MSEITYIDDNGHLVVIMANVIEKLQSYRQLSPVSREAAGVLIGERRENHIVIHAISEPGQGDIRSRFTVVRKSPHHQELVNELHHTSDGTMNYVGEWHTHPERFPVPSGIDKSSWYKDINSLEPMILVIVGQCAMWCGKITGSKIYVLREIEGYHCLSNIETKPFNSN
ncbi:Mov34/MPN/PAD-1 family protein [Rheinheimera metallidurans]|uniref:CBASS system CD-NTase/cGAS isopeptidase Cap3 n=2 Tax=Gammaproteobacteria TaxID=1236 RepID=UPI003AAC9641